MGTKFLGVSLGVLFGMLLFKSDVFAKGMRATVLINGSGSVADNNCAFEQDLSDMYELSRYQGPTTVLSADGKSDKVNGEHFSSCAKDDGTIAKVESPPVGGAATEKGINRVIREITEAAEKGQISELVFYATDHGRGPPSPDNPNSRSFITLWGEEFSMKDFRKVLKGIPEKLKVIGMFDHCFSAAMLRSFYDGDGNEYPRKNQCAIAVSGMYEVARPGYTQGFKDAVKNNPNATFEEAHSYASTQYKDSLPETSTDFFLEKYYKKRVLGEPSVSASALSTRVDCIIGNDEVKGVDVAITAKIGTLQSELGGLLAAAGLKSGSTIDDVEKAYAKYEAQLNDVRKRSAALGDEKYLSELKDRFEKEFGDEYEQKHPGFKARAKKTLDAQSKAIASGDPSAQKAFKEQYSAEIAELDKVIAEGAAYAETMGLKEIRQKTKELDDEAYSIHQTNLALRKVRRNIAQTSAFSHMIRTKDKEAVAAYMDQAQCLNTKVK